MTRLENVRRQRTKHGGDTVEFARWGPLTKSRKHFKEIVNPSHVFGLPNTPTVWEDGRWPVIPISPPIGPAEARLSSHPTKAGVFAYKVGGESEPMSVEYRPGYYKKKKGKLKYFLGSEIIVPIDRVSILTVTSKMSCVSFSLAAGPLGASGTCLASNLSREIFSKHIEEAKAGNFVDAATTKAGFRASDVVEADAKSIGKSQTTGLWICDLCYAGKGNYAKLDSNQIYQIARKIWTDRHLEEGTFAQVMADIIGRALSDDSLMLSKLTAGNYFRIHDSGDFFSFAYFDAWCAIARVLSHIKFWCPTRMWILPAWRDYMKNAAIPPNLIIRPSALVYGAKAPMIPPLAMGSTSSQHFMKAEKHWDCPAYNSPEGSCVGSGCRVCWEHPEIPVNYRVH